MPEKPRFFPPPPALGALLLVALFAFSGCAAHRQTAKMALPPEYSSGVWIFRHRVQLVIPGMGVAQSFDGLMRLDPGKGKVHVVALGGLGMRLFDITLSADGIRVAFLHPVLARMPGAAERIGECIVNIWFDSFQQMLLQKFVLRDGWNITFSGPMVASMWPQKTRYSDTRIPFTLDIYLLQAVEEKP